MLDQLVLACSIHERMFVWEEWLSGKNVGFWSQEKGICFKFFWSQEGDMREFSSVQLLSHVQLFATPWITAHQASLSITDSRSLLKLHRVGDAIQPSHPLSSPSSPTLNPSQHQGLFQWVISLHEVAKVLEFQLKHQSIQWTPRTYLLQDGLVGVNSKKRKWSNTYIFKNSNDSWNNFCFTEETSQRT